MTGGYQQFFLFTAGESGGGSRPTRRNPPRVGRIFAADFANGAHPATGGVCCPFSSRSFRFPFSDTLSVFSRGDDWCANAHTGRPAAVSTFFSFTALVCCAPCCVHLLLKFSFRLPPNSRSAVYRRRTGQYRIERYPAAFCNIEPACRSLARVWQLVNGLTPATGADSDRLRELARLQRKATLKCNPRL